MSPIRVLPESVANKISAGEVIERPASIVKELIENSLDAGAQRIEIEIRNGGKSLIRVTDDGSGIAADELETAFLRHATSKLETAEDLEAIVSFGFRGEALPSIAAVSRCRAQSGVRDADAGREIRIDGGVVKESAACAPRQGTLIEITDLFFNTPARRKFLRTDSTETGHIVDIVTNMALANPSVHFVLNTPKKQILQAPADESLKDRAAAVLGPETAKDLLEIDGSIEGVRVSGLIGKASIARANRNAQRFFINRRWIKSIGLSFALQEGYYGRLMHGQYPQGILFLDIDPDRVDVNVHPTKQQVRLSNEPAIKSLIMSLVAKRLEQSSRVSMEASNQPPTGENADISKEFTGSDTADDDSTDPPDKQPYATPQRPPRDDWNRSTRPARTFTLSEPTEPFTTSPQNVPLPVSKIEEQPTFVDSDEQVLIRRVLGQLHKTYIVAESDAGLILVDQHAAHERVMYEALQKSMELDKPESQSLLLEEVLELHPRQSEVFEEAMPWLQQIGFELEAFGENSYVIRAVPAVFGDEAPKHILMRFIEEKESGSLKGSMEKHADELAALIACKRRSVKAHDSLSLDAMQTLLQRLTRCQNPHHCPHGRPTWIKQTLYQLEKQFKRVV